LEGRRPKLTATNADLLTALLDACRRGLVTIGDAAQLVGIRKADMGDLVAWRMVEAAVWRSYVGAFHHAFPECDAHLYGQPVRIDPPALRPWPTPSPCFRYSAIEAASLTEAQPHLDAPLSNAARDFAEPQSGDPWEHGSRTFAPREPRALAA
jgi:hypothetical protein